MFLSAPEFLVIVLGIGLILGVLLTVRSIVRARSKRQVGESGDQKKSAGGFAVKVVLGVVGTAMVVGCVVFILYREGVVNAIQGTTQRALAESECEVEVVRQYAEYTGFFDYTLSFDLKVRNKTNRKIRATVVVQVFDRGEKAVLSKSEILELGPHELKVVKSALPEAEQSATDSYRTHRVYVSKVE